MTAAADLPFSGGAGTAARALPRETTRTATARRRAALELVAPVRSDAPRAPFVAVVVALLAAGLLGLLVLNTVLAKDAFALAALHQQGRALADQEQSLAREVEGLRSPQALAERASEMGMVFAGPPAYLRLPDGAVLGTALPALAPGEVRLESGEVLPAPGGAPSTSGTTATAEDEDAAEAATDEATEDETADERSSDTTDQSPAEDDR